MSELLRQCGAMWVPDMTFQHWVSMRCPFHDDSSASAQTDGIGFRCFTCSIFYASPIHLLMERENLRFREACEQYDSRVGASDKDLRNPYQQSLRLSGSEADRSSSSRRSSSRRSRRARARARSDGRPAGNPVSD